MIFNLIIFTGVLVMYFTYAKSVKYKEGTIEYLTLQDFFNLGFWMIFLGLLVNWVL